ncbi:hypothetical protein B0H11DRAFT_1700112, partial [Mycena galericulata]
QRPNITTSTVDRVSLAGTALDIAIGRLNAEGQFNGEGTGIAGYLYSQMAEFDIITNQTKYEKTLEQNLDFIQKTRANFSDPTYSFGHAAARAYTAYKNPIFLQYAVQSWWFGRAYTLSESDVSAGEIATKNFSISGVCQTWNNIPETMVGGSFHVSIVYISIFQLRLHGSNARIPLPPAAPAVGSQEQVQGGFITLSDLRTHHSVV